MSLSCNILGNICIWAEVIEAFFEKQIKKQIRKIVYARYYNRKNP
jgi:hypothetical protein